MTERRNSDLRLDHDSVIHVILYTSCKVLVSYHAVNTCFFRHLLRLDAHVCIFRTGSHAAEEVSFLDSAAAGKNI